MVILFSVVLKEAVMIGGPSASQPITELCTDLDRSNATYPLCVGCVFLFMTTVQEQLSSDKSLLAGTDVSCLADSQDVPLFLNSFVTLPNFPAAYMVITFHVTTRRVVLVERMAVSWVASRLLRLSPLHFTRPRRQLLNLF